MRCHDIIPVNQSFTSRKQYYVFRLYLCRISVSLLPVQVSCCEVFVCPSSPTSLEPTVDYASFPSLSPVPTMPSPMQDLNPPPIDYWRGEFITLCTNNKYARHAKSSWRTVALRNLFVVVDRPESYSATHSKNFIFKFGLHFSIFSLCQVKIPDEKNATHVYLLGKNVNKPLVHFD